MKTNITPLNILIQDELISANQRYPSSFQSRSEAYAVIREEIEETSEEVISMLNNIDKMWAHVRTNDIREFNAVVLDIRETAYCCAAEAIQVAAMCDKLLD